MGRQETHISVKHQSFLVQRPLIATPWSNSIIQLELNLTFVILDTYHSIRETNTKDKVKCSYKSRM